MESEDKVQSLQNLSALVDGELDAATSILVYSHWRGDAEARAAWHAYHLIGDVLRSDELAAEPAREAKFLGTLRERLAAEPVVIGPRSIEGQAPGGRPRSAHSANRWPRMMPAAVVAGLMVVAGVLLVTRDGAPGGPTQGVQASSLADGGGGVAAAETQTLVADDTMVRDARLERYVAAHKQAVPNSALGVPPGFLRASAQMPDR